VGEEELTPPKTKPTSLNNLPFSSTSCFVVASIDRVIYGKVTEK